MDNCSLRGRVNAWRGGFIEGALPLAPNDWKLCWSWSKVLFCFPLPFGLNLATLQLCAWWMFLSYTNSWGAPIVGPGLLWTFTIFSHHSFKCTDPHHQSPNQKSDYMPKIANDLLLWDRGPYQMQYYVLTCFDHGTHISTLLLIQELDGWIRKNAKDAFFQCLIDDEKQRGNAYFSQRFFYMVPCTNSCITSV